MISSAEKYIGGFLELDLAAIAECKDSVWNAWHKNMRSACHFKNARSALWYLLDQKKPGKLWLPSYICADIMQGAEAACTPVSFFPCDPVNGVDVEFLKKNVRSGDAVLLVNYYGVMPEQEVLDFVASKPDILWIEDRCQMLWSEFPAYGDWLIYSPRKVLGVPDGGLLLSEKHDIILPEVESSVADREELAPVIMRYEDEGGSHNSIWYEAYKRAEKAMEVSPAPMLRMSRDILKRIELKEAVEARRANARILMENLSKSVKFKNFLPQDVPLCMPVFSEKATEIIEFLAKNGVFCARHWPELASPQAEWPDSWGMAQNMLSLPCDHRYNEGDMMRVAGLVKEVLS